MPVDLPKAVAILLWLLSGTIIFGALVWKNTVLNSVIFLLLFFAVPVALYWTVYKRKLKRDAATEDG